MQHVDTLINARWVLPIAPQNTILDHHTLAIQDQTIVDCLPTADATKQYTATTTIDRSNHVVMPGLVNTHCHSMMTLFRGLADDLPLMEWLTKHMWPAEGDVMCAESIQDGTRLAIAEMLRGGTTTANDHYFFPIETADTFIQEGMRAGIGLMFMNVPNTWAKDEDEFHQKARDAYQNRQSSDLIDWVVAPQGPYTSSDRSLTLAKNMSDEFDLRIHMHMHETIDELNIDLKAHGKHPLQRLDDLGLLSEKFLAVHMVHVNEAEMALCQARGIHVSHCPESNLKLASGFAPIKQFLDAGINVSIGTDGAASNNDLDMWGEVRTASFIAKAVNSDPTVLPVQEALKMITLNGAKAMGLDHKIGSIEKGKLADVIAVDLGSYLTQPLYNPMSQLIYALNRLQVSDVWVAGKQLLDKGEFTQLDIEKTLAKAAKWQQHCQQYQSAATALTDDVAS